MDRIAIDQQMKVESYQRSHIKNKKEEEKQAVEQSLYDDLAMLESRHRVTDQ